jgi:hypothetical protein
MSPGQKGHAKATEYSPLWNALLGADHPACREFAEYFIDSAKYNGGEEEDMTPDVAMGYMIDFYMELMPAKTQLALAMRLIGLAGSLGENDYQEFHQVTREVSA